MTYTNQDAVAIDTSSLLRGHNANLRKKHLATANYEWRKTRPLCRIYPELQMGPFDSASASQRISKIFKDIQRKIPCCTTSMNLETPPSDFAADPFNVPGSTRNDSI